MKCTNRGVFDPTKVWPKCKIYFESNHRLKKGFHLYFPCLLYSSKVLLTFALFRKMDEKVAMNSTSNWFCSESLLYIAVRSLLFISYCKISTAFVRETFTLLETFICGNMNSCRSLYIPERATSTYLRHAVFTDHGFHWPRFWHEFRISLISPESSPQKLRTRKWYRLPFSDLCFSFFIYYASKALIDAVELSFPREKVYY